MGKYKPNIPKSVLDSAEREFSDLPGSRLDAIGRYMGYDAFAMGGPDDLDLGYPWVYLCEGDEIAKVLYCEDALDAIEGAPRFLSVTYGKTPHGGVKTFAYFFDVSGESCAEDQAATIQILEYDANNICVFSLISKVGD